MREEIDFIGKINISDDALYGIHSVRAKNNFPDETPFNLKWYQSLGEVKKACFLTYKSFIKAIVAKYSKTDLPLKLISEDILNAMIEVAGEIADGMYYDFFIVPAIQGGAGTSINMNINEIIANAALKKLGYLPGEYTIIDPIEHANIYQSTNDVVPTSLKVASMHLLNELENYINRLRAKVEIFESNYRNELRIAYTQMQEAVPSSYGKLFGSYSEALSRDWWRISKCFERIKVVNLGGSAVGTGIGVPRFFIMEVVSNLQHITKLPVTRSENLPDATSNIDSLVEVHAILKSHAVNLEKICSDFRLLSSDIVGKYEVELPQKQIGSSIMPAKVNPVVPEFIISSTQKIYANDIIISSLSARGCLDLNAYLPLIGHCLLESIQLLIACNKTITDNIFEGLKINPNISKERLYNSPAITTALSVYIGYNKAAELAKLMKKNKIDVFGANKILGYMKEEKIQNILKAENLLKTGFTIEDLINED